MPGRCIAGGTSTGAASPATGSDLSKQEVPAQALQEVEADPEQEDEGHQGRVEATQRPSQGVRADDQHHAPDGGQPDQRRADPAGSSDERLQHLEPPYVR